MNKIFIVSDRVDKQEFANALMAIDSNLDSSKMFISDLNSNIETFEEEAYLYEKPIDEICLDYKNNALLFVSTIEDVVTVGITIDEYYNKDIFCISLSDFLNIPYNNIKGDDILIVWIDMMHKDANKHSIADSLLFEQTLYTLNMPYLYFNSESKEDVANIIIKYLNADNLERLTILDENN